MGLTVYFAGYSKTIYSTAHPSINPPSGWGVMYSANDCILLKGGSNIVNPVLIWNYGNGAPSGYNYCYIGDFNRFYFIKDWKYISNNNWEIFLEIDVMATYRDEIGASNQYVARSSVEVDSTLIDDLVQTSADVSVISNNFTTNPFTGWKQNGLYVVKTFYPLPATTGPDASPYPIYILDHAEFTNFVREIRNGNIYVVGSGSVIDNFETIMKTWSTNPLDFILSIRFIPFQTIGGNITSQIAFGNFYVNCNAKVVTQGPLNSSYNVAIPKHPQLGIYGKCVSISASKYELYLPCFGKIEIPQSLIVDESTLTVNTIMSLYNCECVAQVKAGANTIDVLKANISVDIPLQNVYITPSSYVSAGVSAVGAITGAITGNPLVSALGAVSAINSIKPVTERVGTGNGDYSEFDREMKVVGTFFRLPSRDNYIIGAPCCKVFRLDTKLTDTTRSIYYQCSKVKIRLPASTFEIERVKSIMEEGFYFE